MDISVIIPTYRSATKAKKVLKHLENQTVQDFETILSIDGNGEQIKLELEKQNLNLQGIKIVCSGKNLGRGGNRNYGVRQSKGELLIFLDDDMEPMPDVISRFGQEHLKNEKLILVGAQMENEKEMKTEVEKFKSHLSRKWLSQITLEPMDRETLFLTGAIFSIRRKNFEALGGFDDSLSDCEDKDLGYRALDQGLEVRFDPGILGYHQDELTFRKYIKRQQEYQTELKKMEKKNKVIPKSLSGSRSKRSLRKIFRGGTFPFLMDRFNLFIVFPKKLRFKIYDMVITAQLED